MFMAKAKQLINVPFLEALTKKKLPLDMLVEKGPLKGMRRQLDPNGFFIYTKELRRKKILSYQLETQLSLVERDHHVISEIAKTYHADPKSYQIKQAWLFLAGVIATLFLTATSIYLLYSMSDLFDNLEQRGGFFFLLLLGSFPVIALVAIIVVVTLVAWFSIIYRLWHTAKTNLLGSFTGSRYYDHLKMAYVIRKDITQFRQLAESIKTDLDQYIEVEIDAEKTLKAEDQLALLEQLIAKCKDQEALAANLPPLKEENKYFINLANFTTEKTEIIEK